MDPPQKEAFDRRFGRALSLDVADKVIVSMEYLSVLTRFETND